MKVIIIFVAVIALFTGGAFGSYSSDVYGVKGKNCTIESFFDSLTYQLNVPRYFIPDEIRNKRVFKYVIVTDKQINLREAEAKMPDSVVLSSSNCGELYVFTDRYVDLRSIE